MGGGRGIRPPLPPPAPARRQQPLACIHLGGWRLRSRARRRGLVGRGGAETTPPPPPLGARGAPPPPADTWRSCGIPPASGHAGGHLLRAIGGHRRTGASWPPTPSRCDIRHRSRPCCTLLFYHRPIGHGGVTWWRIGREGGGECVGKVYMFMKCTVDALFSLKRYNKYQRIVRVDVLQCYGFRYSLNILHDQAQALDDSGLGSLPFSRAKRKPLLCAGRRYAAAFRAGGAGHRKSQSQLR